MTTKSTVSARAGSFMVLGFDFMVDEDFNVWLIEINTSPTNELSTPVTTKVIEDFQRDQAKLYLDYSVFDQSGKRPSIEGTDIGKFKLIYKDSEKKESLRDKIRAQNKEKPKVSLSSELKETDVAECPE